MDTIDCPHCGNPVLAGWPRCQRCGEPQTGRHAPARPATAPTEDQPPGTPRMRAAPSAAVATPRGLVEAALGVLVGWIVLALRKRPLPAWISCFGVLLPMLVVISIVLTWRHQQNEQRMREERALDVAALRHLQGVMDSEPNAAPAPEAAAPAQQDND